MIKPVKIVKSVYPPDNIHDLWIDLTERPAVIKMFKNDGWEGISDAATEQDIKEMQDDLIKAQKMLQSLELMTLPLNELILLFNLPILLIPSPAS